MLEQEATDRASNAVGEATRPSAGARLRAAVPWLAIIALCLAHDAAIWAGMGGWPGLTNQWPIWRDDHPLYYHSALVTRHFLRQSGTTAGYDPSFMAGYAKSVVFPASSTLPELAVAIFGGQRPAVAYKIYVLLAAAAVPWLIALAARSFRASAAVTALAVLLELIYIWTDFPINYAAFGMLPYLLAIPLGLLATAVFCWYLEDGGWRRWALSAALMAGVVLVHFTAAMIVAPAAALAYGATLLQHRKTQTRMSPTRHAGVWAIPVLVLATNAFWWVPGLWLASTKGPSDFAFAHKEGVWLRFWQIVSSEAPIESVLIAAGFLGLAAFASRTKPMAAALGGFIAAGLFWGYLAGGIRALDFLQPGRHTFAFYTGLAVASALGIREVMERLRVASTVRLDRWAVVGLLVVGLRLFGPSMVVAIRERVRGPLPFLASQPPPLLTSIVAKVKANLKPGERLLYEEGGFSVEGLPPDPYGGGRFSGLLPEPTGVEVLGGPYLHAALVANFTQFGEGKLFEQTRWSRDHFERYAKLYRPSAILCWSPWARGFCRSNPDLIEVFHDDGMILMGRVRGFPGAAIEGSADVVAEPGRLVVRNARAGVDGTVVLRYHSVPCLRADPPIEWEPALLERDPTPFIRFRPTDKVVEFEMRFPPGPAPMRGR